MLSVVCSMCSSAGSLVRMLSGYQLCFCVFLSLYFAVQLMNFSDGNEHTAVVIDLFMYSRSVCLQFDFASNFYFFL
jgi:hypothetical protein